MKRTLLVIILLVSTLITTNACLKKKWFEKKDPRIEIVNETTVIFKDVIKIEIKTVKDDQITYVYDLKHSKLIKVARGSFDADLSRGDYLVQSNKKITKTIYEVLIE